MTTAAVIPYPTQAETEVNLRQLIKDALTESHSADVYSVIDEIVDGRLSDDELRPALKIAMRDHVRKVNHELQRKPSFFHEEPRKTPTKWDRVRKLNETGELAILRMRMRVNGEAKFFGDCTVEDIQSLVECRTEKARQTQAWAKRYSSVGALLEQHNVDRVRDLPAREIERLNEAFSRVGRDQENDDA